MIPKVIHWCWLSGEPLPKTIEACLKSWQRVMPDYKVKCWTAESFDFNSIPYVKAAYDNRRWAFCADYIRAFALYNEGGIYLDSDVMVFRRFDDLLNCQCALCVERQSLPSGKTIDMNCLKEKFERANCPFPPSDDYDPCIGIQAAAMFSTAGHPYFLDILNYYKHLRFCPDKNDKNNILIAPTIYASIAVKYGFKYQDARQSIMKGIEIYPNDVIGHTGKISNETLALHMENHSWVVVPWYKKLYFSCCNSRHRIMAWFKIGKLCVNRRQSKSMRRKT